MIEILDEKQCCGCGVCAVKCPKDAIAMLPRGVLDTVIPKIDESKCIDCGICNNICPVANIQQIVCDNYKQEAYATYSKDVELRFASSSGGMFLTFARYCIDNEYLVYGAKFDSDMLLKCTRATNYEELLPLAKSKYLQSDLTEKYREIEALLKNGEKILFVSTPCQVSALKLFLKKEYENLVTVDFFCHGVPSQHFFDKCIMFDDERKSRKTLEYTFRAKVENGVTPHYYSVRYEKNGKENTKTELYYKSLFYALFQQYITLRESCYDCVFATRERASDITIGDFHDIDNYVKGINRFDGVSTVVVNTEKGKNLFDAVRNSLDVYEMNIDKLIEDKVIFAGGTKRPKERDSFINLYTQKDLQGVSKKYFGFKKYYKQAIYYKMPKFLRNALKKLL